jgi:hypothetical protein
VRHRPGTSNAAADALSRQRSGCSRTDGDGSAWSVSEDWEAAQGLVNDLFFVQTTNATSETLGAELCSCFKEEPIFPEVIEALYGLNSDRTEQECRRAQHQALDYIIEDGHLWCIADGKSACVQAKVECITQQEAVALAKEVHANNGHWGKRSHKIAAYGSDCKSMLRLIYCNSSTGVPAMQELQLNTATFPTVSNHQMPPIQTTSRRLSTTP